MRERHPDVEKAAEYLNHIPKFTKRKHTGEELRQMLSMLGAAQEGMRIIHVAGTNGKGSVCAFLDSILREAGYRTGLFTSPHLVSVKERFVFGGRPVSDACFLNAFKAVKERTGEFEAGGLGHPSYFEFLFFMFMTMAREEGLCPDFLILETGMGGRLDATNCILRPLVSVITSISLDHTEYLGGTIPQIAWEKAGILKPGVPVVYDNTVREAADVIRARAQELNCPAWPVDPGLCREFELKDGCIAASVYTQPGRDPERCRMEIPFAAEYQLVNALLAFWTARLLGIGQADICSGIRKTVWPGRMEEVRPGLYVDGAHNEAGIRAFSRAARAIADRRGAGRRILLFAVVSDKDYERMAALLQEELAPHLWLLTRVGNSRGLELATLSGVVERVLETFSCADAHGEETPAKTDVRAERGEARVFADTRSALAFAMEAACEGDLIFCAGSLYLAGEMKEEIRRLEEGQT